MDQREELAALRRLAELEAKAGGKGTGKRNAFGEIAGFMANVNRGLGIGDELAAAGKTAGDVLTGKVRGRNPMELGGELASSFRGNMAHQRQVEDSYAADRPNAAAFGRGTGMGVQALVPAGQTVNAFTQAPRALNMVRGAVTAGVTAAGSALADRGTGAERLKAASSAATDPLTLTLGAAGGALAPAARRAPRPLSQSQQDAANLADIGVSTTIPQRMGRAAKSAEDLGKRFPILGQAMVGAQDRQLEQLNRGVALMALQPVGLGIPKAVKPGFEMVEYVDDALGGIYDKAAKMTPRVQVDDALRNDLAEVAARRVDLSDDEAALFTRVMDDRLNRLSSGEASGEMVKKLHGELGGLQAEAARKGNSTLAAMFGDARRALMGTIERANPQAGMLIKKADKGWQVYSVMNDAAAAASARGGVFLPGQLNTQARSSAKALGSNMAGKGKGTLQEIATSAARLLPDSYGNPGTANATLAGAGLTGAVLNPGKTLVAATALTGAATPYFLMGRKVIEQLPENATQAELQRAAQQLAELATKDPAVAALRRQVAARLSVSAAGVAGGGTQAGRNAFATPANP